MTIPLLLKLATSFCFAATAAGLTAMDAFPMVVSSHLKDEYVKLPH